MIIPENNQEYKKIKVAFKKETNLLTIEIHNESDLYEWIDAFKAGLKLLGFTDESINDIIKIEEE